MLTGLSIAGIIFDMFLISILVTNIYVGQKKGLVGVVFSIASFLVSLIIVFFIYKPVSQLVIDKTDWDDKLSIMIYEKISGSSIDEGGNIVPDEDPNVSNTVSRFIEKRIKNPVNQAKENTLQAAANELSIIMVRAGTAVALFAIARFLLMFLRSVFEVIGNLPFIRLFNEAGGVIYGVIKGFLIIYIFLAILSLLSPLISNWGIIAVVNKAYFGSRMYNNNVLLNLIMGK